MSIELETSSVAATPEWQLQLELKPDDPALSKLREIFHLFGDLKSPRQVLAETSSEYPLSEKNHAAGFPSEQNDSDFKYGIDFFFGKYRGTPLSVEQNAITAIYQRRQGVELWRILKSVAFETPDKRVLIAHVRGDRNIDENALAHLHGFEGSDLTRADVSSLGAKYGTVNPFVQHATIPIQHVFDKDLVEGADYPNDDIVFTSSGDARFYVGFDVRRYVTAFFKRDAEQTVLEVTRNQSAAPRIMVRRRIQVIGGDSGIDTFDFGKLILTSLRKRLEKENAYYGDRSLARIDSRSDPGLGGSIDTALYGKQLRAHVVEIATELRRAFGRDRAAPIVTFSSMAMHGVAGEIVREAPGVEYVGPREALLQILSELEVANVEIACTALLGLPSVYDKERSAFAGEILDRVLPADENVRRQIEKFVHDCKSGRADACEFYEIVRKILQRVTRGKIEALRSKNVAIILGASELEMFANTEHGVPEDFLVLKSNDMTLVAAEIARASKEMVRLIFICPIQAVAELISLKTITPEKASHRK